MRYVTPAKLSSFRLHMQLAQTPFLADTVIIWLAAEVEMSRA